LSASVLLNNEIRIYESIIAGNAPAFKNINSITDTARKLNLILLFFHEKSLNFKANSSNGATSSNENTTVIPVNTGAVKIIALIDSGKKTNEVRNRALAGVGTPIKVSACRVSTLNFARRNDEKTAIIKAM